MYFQFEFISNLDPHRNLRHGLMLTCRHDVDMFTWGRIILSLPKRSYVNWNWPILRKKYLKIDWSVKMPLHWLNITSNKLLTASVVKNMWRIINTIASILHEASFRTKWRLLFIHQSTYAVKPRFLRHISTTLSVDIIQVSVLKELRHG